MSEAGRGRRPRAERRHCDLLVKGGRFLALDAPQGVIDGAAVAIVGARIAEVGAGLDLAERWAPTRTIDAGGMVVSPGFVDAHVHLGAYLGVGPYRRQTGPGPFSGAGDTAVILPMVAGMCAARPPDELVAAAVRPALAAMLRAGITAVVDAGGPSPDGVFAAATDLGIRAAIGPSLADHWHDASGQIVRQADPEVLLGDAEAFVARHAEARHGASALTDGAAEQRDPLVRPLVSAVETTACSDELLAGIARLGARHDIPLHVHSHISAPSAAAHDAHWGQAATDRLRAAGLLDPRCTVLHAGHLTDEDIAAFAASGITVNHNPVGNAMLGFGTTAGRSVPRLVAAGVPVVLGSDFAPSAVTDSFATVRAALALQRDHAGRDDVLGLEQALAMATSGAVPLGRPGELGSLRAGQLADLVLVDVRGAHHLGVDHPVPALALHAHPGDVSTVIVGGRVVVDAGKLVTADEAELLAGAAAARETLSA